MDRDLVWSQRREKLVEWGLYLLLFFCPLAFGAVEIWALGVLQIVTGVLCLAWVWDRRPGQERLTTLPGTRRRRPASERVLTWSFLVFAGVVLFQTLPLPPGVLGVLSPGTHDLYSQTVPGYATGTRVPHAELVDWLLADTEAERPDMGTAASDPAAPPADATGGFSSWRSLSIYPHITRQRLTLLLMLGVLFMVAADHFRSKERLARAFNAAIGAAFLVSLIGILQKLSGDNRIYWFREGDYNEVFGPFVNRNSYAAFAGTVLPVAICLALRARHRLRSGYESALPQMLFLGFASTVIAGGIFFSLSRGGMIAAGLAVAVTAVLLLFLGRNATEVVALGLLVVLAAGFVLWIGPDEVVQRVETLAQGTGTPSFAVRLVAWGRAAALLGDHVALGSGLGTFRFAIQRYSPPGRAWWTTAHNEYLEIACDTGLLGALLALIAVAAYLLRIWRPGLFRGSRRVYVFVGLVAGLFGLAVHSVVSSNLQVPANAVLAVLLAAALLNVVRNQEGRGRRREPRPRPHEVAAGGARP